MSNVEAIKKAFPNMFRPLKWNHFPGATEYGSGEWFAHGTNKSYQIFDVRSKFPDDLPFYAKEISCQFETLEEAKEAVRTRDEQDILTRLDPEFLTTLEALQRENEVLREALKPFAEKADARKRKDLLGGILFTQPHLLAARTALASAGEHHAE